MKQYEVTLEHLGQAKVDKLGQRGGVTRDEERGGVLEARKGSPSKRAGLEHQMQDVN